MLKYMNQINVNMELKPNGYKYFTLLEVNCLLKLNAKAEAIFFFFYHWKLLKLPHSCDLLFP